MSNKNHTCIRAHSTLRSNIVVLSLGGLCTRPPAWQTAGVIALWKNQTIKTQRVNYRLNQLLGGLFPASPAADAPKPWQILTWLYLQCRINR